MLPTLAGCEAAPQHQLSHTHVNIAPDQPISNSNVCFVLFFSLRAIQKASVQPQVQHRAAGFAHFDQDSIHIPSPMPILTDRSSCASGVALTSCTCPHNLATAPVLVPGTNIHPRARPRTPNPAFVHWLRDHTVPSPPSTQRCHQRASPANCSGCYRNCVKDTWVLQPGQRNGLLPCLAPLRLWKAPHLLHPATAPFFTTPFFGRHGGPGAVGWGPVTRAQGRQEGSHS